MRVSAKHQMIMLREQRNLYHLRIMKVEEEDAPYSFLFRQVTIRVTLFLARVLLLQR